MTYAIYTGGTGLPTRAYGEYATRAEAVAHLYEAALDHLDGGDTIGAEAPVTDEAISILAGWIERGGTAAVDTSDWPDGALDAVREAVAAGDCARAVREWLLGSEAYYAAERAALDWHDGDESIRCHAGEVWIEEEP